MQYSQENTCVGIFYYGSFFYRTPPVAASDISCLLMQEFVQVPSLNWEHVLYKKPVDDRSISRLGETKIHPNSKNLEQNWFFLFILTFDLRFHFFSFDFFLKSFSKYIFLIDDLLLRIKLLSVLLQGYIQPSPFHY